MEVLGDVETGDGPGKSYSYDEEMNWRRAALAQIYDELPRPASKAFWVAVERDDTPLEVLVCCLRRCEDSRIRNQLMEIIIQRTRPMNEYWANSVLRDVAVQADERRVLQHDLCADLYESVFRAVMDANRRFWEENFLHCLRFERRHVYRSFMMREGRWRDANVKKSMRIPRAALASLDQLVQRVDDTSPFDVEDEKAQAMFLAAERSDLLRLVLCLPDALKATIFLLFWEGRTEKETAQVLGVTDRTVRNRLREALKRLRDSLPVESEAVLHE